MKKLLLLSMVLSSFVLHAKGIKTFRNQPSSYICNDSKQFRVEVKVTNDQISIKNIEKYESTVLADGTPYSWFTVGGLTSHELAGSLKVLDYQKDSLRDGKKESFSYENEEVKADFSIEFINKRLSDPRFINGSTHYVYHPAHLKGKLILKTPSLDSTFRCIGKLKGAMNDSLYDEDKSSKRKARFKWLPNDTIYNAQF